MREGADLLEGHSAVDPVACCEPGDVPTGFLDDPGEFIAHDQRHLVGGDELDFTADDHVVERVDRRGHDFDQHFRVAGLWDGDVTDFEVGAVFGVMREDVCFHEGLRTFVGVVPFAMVVMG